MTISDDPELFAQLEARFNALAWGPEALQFGRELASYEDQRGWRFKAAERYRKLLEKAKDDPIAVVTLHLDLADLGQRWENEYLPVHLLEAKAHYLKNYLDDWQLVARQYRLSALNAARMKRFKDAQADIQYSLNLYQEHEDKIGAGWAMNAQAYIYLMTRNFNEAAELTGEVIRKINVQEEPHLYADAIGNHGYALRRLDKDTGNQKAIELCQQALAIHDHRRDPLNSGMVRANLAVCLQNLGRFAEAEATLFEALEMMRKEHILDMAGVLFNILAALRIKSAGSVTRDAKIFVDAWSDDFIATLSDPASKKNFVNHFCKTISDVRMVLDKSEKDRLLMRLRDSYHNIDLSFTGAYALACARLVEKGGDGLIMLDTILDQLEKFIPYFIQFVKACWEAYKADPNAEDKEETTDNNVINQYGRQVQESMSDIVDQIFPTLRETGQGAAIILSHSVEARQLARSRSKLISEIKIVKDAHEELGMIYEILQVLDNEELILIRPGMLRGYRVKISGIADNFQLHTLLADALTGNPQDGWLPGKKPDPRLVAAYTDKPVDREVNVMTGVFNMANWEALLPSGQVSDNADHWIWGEGTPGDIHIFEGHRIILLTPPPYVRTWTVGRKFLHMPGILEVIEILREAGVRSWLERLTKQQH